MKRAVVSAWLVVLTISGSLVARGGQQAAASSSDGTSVSVAGAGGGVGRTAVPRLVRFSGTVRDAGARPQRGPVDVTFSLYREEAGGEPLWFETQTVEADTLGRYSVLLGAASSDGLPTDLFTSGEARWLGVSVGRLPEQPRVLLVAVPYALKAADADTLGGKPATAFVASDQFKDQVRTEVKAQVTDSGSFTRTLVGTAPTPQVISETSPGAFTCATSGICLQTSQSGAGGIAFRAVNGAANTTTAIFDNLAGGKIISGRAASFAEKFYVDTGGNLWAGGSLTANAYAGTSGAAIFGVVTATSGAAYGVRGQSASPSGVGVFGYATSPTGFTYGLLGSNLSASGTGFSGSASSPTGVTIGVRAVVQSPNGTAAIFDNLGGGKLLSARTTGYVERLGLDGSGNLVTAGTMTGTRLISNIATGTAPLTVSSTTNVANLNADLLDGFHAAAFQLAGTYATLGANSFVGDQSITGNLTLSGSVNSGLVVRANATSPSIIEGFSGNTITTGVLGGTIGGGGVTANANVVTDDYGTIGGGYGNQAGGNIGTTSDQTYATVAGGFANKARASGSAVGGGAGNIADGVSSTIPGGNSNTATGYNSFAAGFHAQAGHDGAFVWSDNSAVTSTASTAVNQFIVRAAGGVWFGTTSTPGSDLTAGRFLATSTGAYLTTGGAWTNSSDRNLKTNLASVDGRTLLAKLKEIPISTWNYRVEDASVRHMGPMAQDFRAAFGLGEDDKHISTVDAAGVSLAAIQALYEITKEKDQKIEQLTQQVSELQEIRKQMAILQTRLARLEKQNGNAVASRASVSRSTPTNVKVKF